MKEISNQLKLKSTDELLKMVDVLRKSTDEGNILVWDCLITELEERIVDKVYEL